MIGRAAPVITAWETYSPLGHGADAHLAALRATEPNGVRHTVVADFSVREILGRTGTRSMDRVAGLAVATTRRLLQRADTEPAAGYPSDEIGLVLGVGDVIASAMDFVRDTWTRERPYDVDPAHVPRTLMNYAAGQCAIWHGLRGPNATICGNRSTGLLALNYARRLHRGRHARAVVWGAVEELSAQRVAVEQARGATLPAAEGCVMFLLESAAAPANRPALAEVVGIEFGFTGDPDDGAAAVGDCLRRLLARTGVAAHAVRAVITSGGTDLPERTAVADLFGDRVLRARGGLLLGDTRSATVGFALAELLAQPDLAGEFGMVTTSDPEGRVGCGLFRMT